DRRGAGRIEPAAPLPCRPATLVRLYRAWLLAKESTAAATKARRQKLFAALRSRASLCIGSATKRAGAVGSSASVARACATCLRLVMVMTRRASFRSAGDLLFQ